MVLQEYKQKGLFYLIVIQLVVLGCSNSKHTVSFGSMTQTELKDEFDSSTIVYRLFFENEISDNRFLPFCSDGNALNPDFYSKSFKYGDLNISFVYPDFHNNNRGEMDIVAGRKSLSIKYKNKYMHVALQDPYIGNYNIYIDSLSFKEGDFYIDLENKVLHQHTLQKKLKKLEKWKPSSGLVNPRCKSEIPAFAKIDSLSDKNLIQYMLGMDFIKVSQDDLVTYNVLYNRREKERIRKARLKSKG